MWQPGQRLTHRFNPELGPGRVVALEGRRVVVEFPAAGQRLTLAASSPALVPLVLLPGQSVRVEAEGRIVRLAALLDGGLARLEDGREVDVESLWPAGDDTPLERLAAGRLDRLDDFKNRLDALHLLQRRETSGLGSFLGGRIQIFPHQLHAAERATRSDPVRWLLADEVGLGKTVEACLILNHLLHTGRARRVLIVAPANLIVQWLGELWRKYHQVFALLDEARLRDVAREFGEGFSPFDVHSRVVVALETLLQRPDLAAQAAAAGTDLLIVDEAHHLRRPPGHPGVPAYRCVEPLAAAARHVLLLSATPLEDDAHGFLRLLQLLRPQEFSGAIDVPDRLARPLPPCVSATRRAGIGGLPPRRLAAVDVDDDAGWRACLELERHLAAAAAAGPMARRERADRVRRALALPAAVAPLLARGDHQGHRLAATAAAQDPRPTWLAAQAQKWKEAGDKTLVFVADRDTLLALKPVVERLGRLRAGVYHEDLSPGQRDIEVAQFRLPDGPSLLISTECGGEGRNFQFCRRLVLYDMPWEDTTVEQRIGRLDRIGRSEDVEIVTLRPPAGRGAARHRHLQRIGVFSLPLAGRRRLDAATGEVLYQEPYRGEMAEEILARVPTDLDTLTAAVVLSAAEAYGFDVERRRGESTWSLVFGRNARIDHLPGVPPASSYMGTFSRAEGVDRETLDYFASGHLLVEGVLAELEESQRGRVALLPLPGGGGPGLLALYRQPPGFTAVAVDAGGRRHPEWEALVQTWPLRGRRLNPGEAAGSKRWRETVELLARHLDAGRRPEAVALLVNVSS